MTPRERAVAALCREEVDRVPIFELMIDPRVVEALLPGGSYADFCDAFDVDMVITPTPSCLYGKTFLEERDGIRYFRTEWGDIRADTGDMVPIPTGGFPIQTREDLDAYRVPDPLAPERMSPLRALLDRFKGRRAVGIHLHDAFSYPTYLMGMENLLLAIHTDPELVHALVALSAEHQSAMIRAACALGADYVLLGDDYCNARGPLMSPKHFAEFFLPGIRKVVETIKSCGAFAVKHTDGNILPILEGLIDAGIDAFHPCDPSAGLVIADMKKRYGRRLTFMGNVDTGPLLSDASPAEVRSRVSRLIADTQPGNGWIISSANTIHRGVRPENYRAMLETVCAGG